MFNCAQNEYLCKRFQTLPIFSAKIIKLSAEGEGDMKRRRERERNRVWLTRRTDIAEAKFSKKLSFLWKIVIRKSCTGSIPSTCVKDVYSIVVRDDDDDDNDDNDTYDYSV